MKLKCTNDERDLENHARCNFLTNQKTSYKETMPFCEQLMCGLTKETQKQKFLILKSMQCTHRRTGKSCHSCHGCAE